MKFLASDPIFIQQFEAIDAEKGIIKGVKVCSEGEAKGHGVYLNKQFIKNVVKFGKEQNNGVKARFGHPNMCDTTLGTFIGRYRNFRSIGEPNNEFEEYGKPRKSGNRLHAVADLHLDDTAKNLPKLGNAHDYILNLAQSSPDMFGSSIVFKMGDVTRNKWKDDDGDEKHRDDASITALLATDLVDSPAATDGLFENFTTDEMAIQVTQFLNQHPEVYELAVNHPDIIESFLQKYESYKNHKPMTTKKSGDEKVTKTVLQSILDDIQLRAKKLFTKKDDKGDEVTEIPEETQKEIDSLQEKIDAFKDPDADEKEALKKENEEFKARIKELEGMLSKGVSKSTKTIGPEGKEGDDDGDSSLSKEDKSLKEDLKKLRGELSRVED